MRTCPIDYFHLHSHLSMISESTEPPFPAKQITLPLSPAEVAKRLQHLPNMLFFDSSGNFPQNSQQAISIITAKPTKVINGDLYNPSDLEKLQNTIQPWTTKPSTHPFPCGGACGYIDYEGQFCFGIYPEMLIFLHETKTWWQCGDLESSIRTGSRNIPKKTTQISSFSSSMSKEQYESHVKKIQDYITAGDIYQVNLTQCFSANIKGESLFSLYEQLRETAPAPVAAWMKINGREILSSSPETFLKISNNKIETRPIKGTRPRFQNKIQDLESAQELIHSEKERAELVMITDLERNDLGKVCEFGSVQVIDMLALEKLEHVYHLVSTVSGTLRKDTDHITALKACFPGGSITGAPKKRAMEIINDLETKPRGLYTGAMGYFGFNGESQFNIPIRTLIRENGTLHYHVGAGIVADSDPAAEYQETLDKAKGIKLAIERLQD